MIDIEELKKLPTQAKVELIDELIHSMDDAESGGNETVEEGDNEIVKEMEQRLDDMESGKDAGYTWEEAKAILMEGINERKLHHG